MGLEPDAYDVITVSFFDVLADLDRFVDALAPGGVLVYEHHLQTADPIDVGPSDDEYRFEANELLRACLGELTILSYEERRRREPIAESEHATDETTASDRDGGNVGAIVTLVARNSSGAAQSYPLRPNRYGRAVDVEPQP